MKTLHLYILIIALSSSSCVIYQKTPSTPEEAANPKSRRIKIATTSGDIYRLNWVNVENNGLSSIQKTRQNIYELDEIKYIMDAGNSLILMKDTITFREGELIIETRKNTVRCFRIEKYENEILATQFTSKDTASIFIPKDQIEKIQIKNRSASTAGNIFIGIGTAATIIVGIGIYDLSENGISVPLPIN